MNKKDVIKRFKQDPNRNPLVRSAYEMLKKEDSSVTIQKVFSMLKREGILDKSGNATQWAIDEGLVYDASDEQRIKELKAKDPILSLLDDNDFNVDGDAVGFSVAKYNAVIRQIINDPDADIALKQLARNKSREFKNAERIDTDD